MNRWTAGVQASLTAAAVTSLPYPAQLNHTYSR